MNATLAFVFGTLREGFPNSRTNTGIRVPGLFVTVSAYPFHLVGERHSPWLVNQPGHGLHVVGELFEVNDAGLAAMDRLERVDQPDGYRRTAIWVRDAGAPDGDALQAFAYLKDPSQLRRADLRAGPLREYTLAHAALYRPR